MRLHNNHGHGAFEPEKVFDLRASEECPDTKPRLYTDFRFPKPRYSRHFGKSKCLWGRGFRREIPRSVIYELVHCLKAVDKGAGTKQLPQRWLDLYLGVFLAKNGHLCHASVGALTRSCYGHMPPRQRRHLGQHSKNAVSYTHLTLPTNREV